MSGNPEHCINLLQLAKEISCMMNTNTEPQALEGSGGPEEGDQESGEEVQAASPCTAGEGSAAEEPDFSGETDEEQMAPRGWVERLLGDGSR